MTLSFGREAERFTWSVFLVLCNRLVTSMLAASVLLVSSSPSISQTEESCTCPSPQICSKACQTMSDPAPVSHVSNVRCRAIREVMNKAKQAEVGVVCFQANMHQISSAPDMLSASKSHTPPHAKPSVLLQSKVCMLLQAKQQSAAPAAPVTSYAAVSLSNVIATSCQYEALKHVAFPVQTLGKCAKMIPVMIWGTLISRKAYSLKVCTI